MSSASDALCVCCLRRGLKVMAAVMVCEGESWGVGIELECHLFECTGVSLRTSAVRT
jgi:hypothetical protein